MASNADRPGSSDRAHLHLGRNIADRLVAFAAAVVRLSGRLPKDPSGRHVAIQMVRSATAAGANYEEARAAESRADFVHKAGVALKELREARYWAGLVQQTGWVESDLDGILREANELAAILGASVRTARARGSR
jgi:four helix bundle protein